MGIKGSTNKGASIIRLGAYSKIRGMLGSKRRLIAPFVVAAVLMLVVSLFLLISDSLITTVVDDMPDFYPRSIPGVILPASEDWMDPEAELPEFEDVFKVKGAPNTSYLRCFVATEYDGDIWIKDSSTKPQVYNGDPISYDVNHYSSSAIDHITITPLVDFRPGYIPTAPYTTQVDSEEDLLVDPDTFAFYLRKTSGSPYQFTTTHYEFEPEVLKSAEILDDDRYLQLPDNITDRTRKLALEITADYDSPSDKAKAIETYLLTGYEYTTDFSPSPADVESTHWFLFENKKGIHTHFSSAFVVLARCAGLTTRLVSGYFIMPQAEEQTVNTIQAICVAEMGFKELGWISYNNSLGQGFDIETFTYIDEPVNNGEVIEKGQPFTVSGGVETAEGFSVVGMPVSVWLWQGELEDKPGFIDGIPTKSAYYVASGIVTSEGYSVECYVPDYIVAGDWNIIVNALGYEPFYLPSDSDPDIIIVAPSELDFTAPNTATVGAPTIFQGRLSDAENDDLPISDALIKIDIRNIDDSGVIVDTVSGTTFSDGGFVIPYVFGAEGDYSVTASFTGSTYFLASGEVTKNTHVSWDTALTFDTNMPDEGKEGTAVNINGRLTTDALLVPDGAPLAGRTVNIHLDDLLDDDEAVPLGAVVTDADGYFSLDYDFNDSGKYRIIAQYVGEQSHVEPVIDPETSEIIGEQTVWTGEVYYKSSANIHSLTVYGPPTLTLVMDENVDVGHASPFINVIHPIQVTLIDEFGEPLTQASVDFYQIRNGSTVHLATLLTDDDGIIDHDIEFESLGERTISAVFEETSLFPGTEDSVDVTVWLPTSITINDLSAHTRIKQGTTVHMEGVLLDYWDDPLPAGTVVNIMTRDWSIAPIGWKVLTSTTTDAAGNYSLDWDFDVPDWYKIWAGFPVDEDDYIKASSTQPPYDIYVYGPPTLDIIMDPRWDIDNQPVPIDIYLRDEFGNNMEGHTVDITISDGTPLIQRTTNALGRFSLDLEHTFADVGDYTVTVEFHETALHPGTTSIGDIKIMMPTVLTVSVPNEQKLGEPVTINGTLVDAYGDPLGGETIILKDGSTLITTVVTLGDGSYSYEHTFAESGDRVVNAEYAENVYLKSSAASDVIRVYGPPTLEITVNDKGDRGVPVLVEGHLYDEFGNNLSFRTVTFQFSDGSPNVSMETDAEGRFSLMHAFAVEGDYTVTASFAGAGLYPPASDASDDTRIMIPTALTLDMPDYIKINTEMTIAAYLTEADTANAIAGQTVRIYDGITLIATLVTDAQGKVSYDYIFSSQGVYAISAGFNEIEFYRAAGDTEGIEVRIGTSLVLDIVSYADVDEAVLYEGHLYDEYGNPLAGEPVFIHLGSKKAIAQLTTDSIGDFVMEDVFAIAGALLDGSDSPLAGQVIDVLIDDGDSQILLGQMTTLPNGSFVLSGIDLKGNLTDDSGTPLPNHTVDLELDYSMFFPLAMLLADGDGDYSQSISLGLEGIVSDALGDAVQNAEVDLGLDNDGDGVPDVELLIGEATDANGRFTLNRDVVVQGTLLDTLGDPMAHQDIQLLFATEEPELLKQTVTNAQGYFILSIDGVQFARLFEQVGDYNISAFYPGSTGYLPAHDSSAIKILMPTALTTATNPSQQAKVGTPVTITGTLVDKDGNPLAGQSIRIYGADEIEFTISEEPVYPSIETYISGSRENALPFEESRVTDENGQFTYEHIYDGTGEYMIGVLFEGMDYLRAAEYTMDIKISGEPLLTFDTPEHAKQHDRVTIGGTLINEFISPVAGAEIIISIYRQIDDSDDGVQQIRANVDTSDMTLVAELTVTTNADGTFSQDYKFLETGDYVIIASYAESDLYLETEADFNINITQVNYGVSITRTKGTEDYLWWVLVAIAALAGACVAYMLVRRAKAKLGYMMASSGSTLVLDEDEAPVATILKHPDAASMEIVFEQAPPPLTDVWAVNEELIITCRLYDRNHLSLAGGLLEISLDDSKLGRVVTDNTGTASINHTFSALGTYNISCYFAGENKNRPWTESRVIKIVDFRAEGIDLLDSIVTLAKGRGVPISKRLTPREIEQRIVFSLKKVDQQILDRFIGCAEEALYSSHDFTRDNYIDMLGTYKAIRGYIEES